MKRKLLFLLLLAAFLLLVTAAAVTGDDPESERIRYDVTGERAFEGIAANAGYVVEGFTYFTLKTGKYVVDVQMGPKEFMDRSGFQLKASEPVTVIGMPITIDGRAMVLTREIRAGDRLFVARDRNGESMWDPNRPVQMDTELPIICE